MGGLSADNQGECPQTRKGGSPQTIGESVRRHSQGIPSADNRGECRQTLTQTIGVSLRRHSKRGLSADNPEKVSADTQRGDCPQTIGVRVRRRSQGGLSADNRGECPQTLKEGTVRRQSTGPRVRRHSKDFYIFISCACACDKRQRYEYIYISRPCQPPWCSKLVCGRATRGKNGCGQKVES